MTILEASILFSRAGTVYNQLRALAFGSGPNRERMKVLLDKMDSIYMSPNTRANRDSLHAFIKRYALEIANGYRDAIKDKETEGELEFYPLKDE